jgi:predicted ferric reductase
MKTPLVWTALAAAIGIPIAAAATSPLLEWREPIYIAAGFAGIVAMALLLLQPLLAAGYLPGISAPVSRRGHRWVGGFLVLAVVIHVAGLWITSPPDVIDALLLVSPTPFSIWGVIAMWGVVAAAVMAFMQRQIRINRRTWRAIHKLLAVLIIVGTVVHAMLIEGTMEVISKTLLCLLVVITTSVVLTRLARR